MHRGRIVVLHCGVELAALHICCVHLVREVGRLSPDGQSGLLRRSVGSCDDGRVALVGDWNVVTSTEGRWCVRTGTPSYGQDSVAEAFDRLFSEFVEVRQLAYTRRQLRYPGGAPEVHTVSRLGRFWTNAATPVLLSRQFADWARGTAYDRGMPSDHVAVSMRWLLVRRARRRVVPQWVAGHPACAGFGAEVAREVELEMVDDPFEHLVLAGDVLQHASRRPMALAAAPSVAHRPAWVAHWLSAARTAARRRDGRALGRPPLRVTAHVALFDVEAGTLRSEADCAESLRVVVHESLVQTCRLELELAESEQAKSAVRSKCASVLSLWAASRPSVCRLQLPRSRGRPLCHEEERRKMTSSGGANFVAHVALGVEPVPYEDFTDALRVRRGRTGCSMGIRRRPETMWHRFV